MTLKPMYIPQHVRIPAVQFLSVNLISSAKHLPKRLTHSIKTQYIKHQAVRVVSLVHFVIHLVH